VAPLEFNGREDSLFQPYNAAHEKFMEYVEDLGSYADVPLENILSAWEVAYGRERLQSWIRAHENSPEGQGRDFEQETVISD
jgi:hypothetical protein